jgi:hypothetical protein
VCRSPPTLLLNDDDATRASNEQASINNKQFYPSSLSLPIIEYINQIKSNQSLQSINQSYDDGI